MLAKGTVLLLSVSTLSTFNPVLSMDTHENVEYQSLSMFFPSFNIEELSFPFSFTSSLTSSDEADGDMISPLTASDYSLDMSQASSSQMVDSTNMFSFSSIFPSDNSIDMEDTQRRYYLRTSFGFSLPSSDIHIEITQDQSQVSFGNQPWSIVQTVRLLFFYSSNENDEHDGMSVSLDSIDARGEPIGFIASSSVEGIYGSGKEALNDLLQHACGEDINKLCSSFADLVLSSDYIDCLSKKKDMISIQECKERVELIENFINNVETEEVYITIGSWQIPLSKFQGLCNSITTMELLVSMFLSVFIMFSLLSGSKRKNKKSMKLCKSMCLKRKYCCQCCSPLHSEQRLNHRSKAEFKEPLLANYDYQEVVEAPHSVIFDGSKTTKNNSNVPTATSATTATGIADGDNQNESSSIESQGKLKSVQ